MSAHDPRADEATTATAVRERPILFSGEMVRAILDGRKTQTRRVVKPTLDDRRPYCMWMTDARRDDGSFVENGVRCPYGAVGDHLWVRETWFGNRPGGPSAEAELFRYRATDRDFLVNGRSVWRSGIIMPRKASRLSLEITNVRVERLQAIGEDDAYDEGCEGHGGEPRIDGEGEWARRYITTSREQYRALWDSPNAKRGHAWDVNPWVWVIEFQRLPESSHVR
jgi:hypothetical protein